MTLFTSHGKNYIISTCECNRTPHFSVRIAIWGKSKAVTFYFSQSSRWIGRLLLTVGTDYEILVGMLFSWRIGCPAAWNHKGHYILESFPSFFVGDVKRDVSTRQFEGKMDIWEHYHINYENVWVTYPLCDSDGWSI